MKSIENQYIDLWSQFSKQLKSFNASLEEQSSNLTNHSLHDLVKRIYWIPKDSLTKYLLSTQGVNSHPNVGSVTGMFFENLINNIIRPYIRSRILNVKIEQNHCNENKIKEISRDPDFFISNNNNHVIIELKVAPKHRDISLACKLRENYNKIGVDYFLIGGWVSINKKDLINLSRENWLCFFDSSKNNQQILEHFPEFDDILQSIISALNN